MVNITQENTQIEQLIDWIDENIDGLGATQEQRLRTRLELFVREINQTERGKPVPKVGAIASASKCLTLKS